MKQNPPHTHRLPPKQKKARMFYSEGREHLFVQSSAARDCSCGLQKKRSHAVEGATLVIESGQRSLLLEAGEPIILVEQKKVILMFYANDERTISSMKTQIDNEERLKYSFRICFVPSLYSL